MSDYDRISQAIKLGTYKVNNPEYYLRMVRRALRWLRQNEQGSLKPPKHIAEGIKLFKQGLSFVDALR